MAPDSKLELHKKTILDIANSKTTYEACKSLFRNIKEIYNLADSFETRFIKAYPTLFKFLSSLKKREHEFYTICIVLQSESPAFLLASAMSFRPLSSVSLHSAA